MPDRGSGAGILRGLWAGPVIGVKDTYNELTKSREQSLRRAGYRRLQWRRAIEVQTLSPYVTNLLQPARNVRLAFRGKPVRCMVVGIRGDCVP